MKFKSLFCALLAGLTLSACSNDEGVTDKVDKTTDQAYVTISLRNAGALTRGTNGDLQYGEATENAVSTAEFYFFNADGSYNQVVSKTLNWKAGTETNVEKIADATVVLQNLKKVGKPKYVVCVLNGEVGKYTDMTIAKLKEQISKDYLTSGKFIMTNSTYNNGDATSQNFATVIEDVNFLKEKPTEETLTPGNAVQIYVERLASKMTLTTSLSNTNEISIGSYDVNGETKEIKIKVLGWGINALNKTSYVEKRVPVWTTNLDFAWDAKDLKRSFWACSPNYGGGEYPLSFANVVEDNNSTDKVTVNTDADYSLKYVSWNSLTKTLGQYDYCLENTNTKAVLEADNFKAKVTHVLLRAQTVDATDLIRYDGRLYTEANFLNRILNQLQLTGPLYYMDGSTYKQIATSDLAVVNTYDGTVNMALTEAAAGKQWYVKNGEEYTACEVATITDRFNTLQIKADYYKSGMMYYCIPVEHLRNTGKLVMDDNLNVTVEEGAYGVVRNHHYVININSIANLGTAVYNPDEEIIPNKETPTYYVGAQVNILSWKVVNQSVDL